RNLHSHHFTSPLSGNQENNMVDLSVGKKRCMAWPSQVRTATGKPWKASS
ncbi:SDF2 isoform 5, partial [Pan troglodytes]